MKRTYFYSLTTTFLSIFAASLSFAETEYYYVPASTDAMQWDTLASWKTTTDGGKTFTDATELPSATSTAKFDSSIATAVQGKGDLFINLDGNVSVGEFSLIGDCTNSTGGAANLYLKSTDKTSDTASESVLTINGNFNRTLNGTGGYGSSRIMSGSYNALSVEIKGNVNLTRASTSGTLTYGFGGNSSSNALKSLKIGGDFNAMAGQISFGTFIAARDAAKIAQDKYYYYKNADVQIGGVMNSSSTIFLNSVAAKAQIISANGLTGYDIRSTNNSKGTVGSNTTLVLTNTAAKTFNGGITDLYSYNPSGQNVEGRSQTNAIIDVVMMGSAQQKLILSSNKRAFRGGTTVISGDLRMYTYYKNNTAEGEWGKWGDLRMVGNSDGIAAKFGAIGSNGNATDSNAIAYADNLVWTGGTIVSGIISKTQASLIELSGTIKKGTDAGNEFWFEFTGNTNYLTEDGVSIRLISWTSTNKPTEFLESEFKAAKIGDKYANFKIESDGLYVSYSNVIPEPATIGAICAALALAFAVWRRRK